MTRSRKPEVPFPFGFGPRPHCRVHGPRGHVSYAAYKDWLRDEFEFRCVYCQTRERWSGAGQRTFTIDHVKPKSRYPDLTCDYDNLVYACGWCNLLKSTLELPDPCRMALGKHLRLDRRTKKFVGVTSQGKRLVEYLRLNKRERVDERTKCLYAFEMRRRTPADVLDCWFGYPADLPDLARLKPPSGNTRPAGVARGHYARRERRELAPYY